MSHDGCYSQYQTGRRLSVTFTLVLRMEEEDDGAPFPVKGMGKHLTVELHESVKLIMLSQVRPPCRLNCADVTFINAQEHAGD